MKTKLIISIIILTNAMALAQDFSLQVKLSQENATKAQSITKNHEMVALAKRYKSEGLSPSYPNFKNPELALYFDFRGKGNVNNAIKELTEMKFFQEIVEEELFYTLSCDSPLPPVNDAWLVQNPNYALELINARCAWSIIKGDPSILIGVADTEFEITHQDLANQIVSINGPVSAGHRHGTQVAGVAGAQTNNGIGIAGIGYNSKIAAQRVQHTINEEGRARAFSADIRAAINALYGSGVPIINVSWSGTGLEFEAAEEITQNGTLLVLSAGNRPSDRNHGAIANIPGVVVVSSVNFANQHGPTGHAHNEWVDICAPGTNVATTTVNNDYLNGGGTSYAAPYVAGTAALMLSINPCLTPSAIENMLKQSAAPIADGHLFHGLLGAGRLNAYEAVKAAGTRSLSYTTLSGNQSYGAGYALNVAYTNIDSNSNITLTARNEVNISMSFNMPLGSTLEITIDPDAVNTCN